MVSDAAITAPRPTPAMAIMMAKDTIRPAAANMAGVTPLRAALVSDSRLLGPNAMLMAKQAGAKMRNVSRGMGQSSVVKPSASKFTREVKQGHLPSPRFSGEREGPIAKQWEGEGHWRHRAQI